MFELNKGNIILKRKFKGLGGNLILNFVRCEGNSILIVRFILHFETD